MARRRGSKKKFIKNLSLPIRFFSAFRKKPIGKAGEIRAVRYLKSKRHKIFATNYACRRGEVDIISLDPNSYLVFSEVKTRPENLMQSGLLAVSAKKRNKIKKAAGIYLLKNERHRRFQPRFDIILVGVDNKRFIIEHIENAF